MEFIEFGCISIDSTQYFECLVKPYNPISDEIMEKTGISNYMLSFANDLDYCLKKLVDFWDGDEIVIIGYDIVFSGMTLEKEFKKFYINYPNIRYIDLLHLSKWINPKIDHDLISLCEFYNIDVPINRSLHDCMILQKLFFELKIDGEKNDIIVLFK